MPCPELGEALEALRDEERYLRSITDSAPDVVISVDRRGIICYASRAIECVFGYSAGEVTGKSITMLIPERFIPRHLEGMKKWSQTSDEPSVRECELTGLRKNGEEFCAEASFSCARVRGKDYFTIIVRDASERKKAQRRIEKLNNCLLSFKTKPDENINSLVGLCGELLGATCALYNRLNERLLFSIGRWNTPIEYKVVDDPQGHICYDVIRRNKGEVAVFRHLLKSKYAKTDPNVRRYKLQTYLGAPVKFGEVCIGSVCAVYQKDFEPPEEDKKFIGLLASAIGVEEGRRLSESSLQDSEERFRAISVSTMDTIVLIDEKGKISYWNPAAEQMFGYSKEEVLGEVAFTLLSPKSFHSNYSQFQNLLNLEQNHVTGRVVEYSAVKKDGTEFPVEISISRLKIKEKSHALAVIRDISQRKQMEHVLQEREDKYREISKKLESLMKSSAVMLHTTDLRERLRTVAEAIREQGWGRVVITLRDEKLNTTDVFSAGISVEEEQYIKEHQAPGRVWRKRLSSMFERYRLGEFYYLPWSDPLVKKQFKYALSSKVTIQETVDWNPDDLLYVPLRLPNGQVVGIMSMDDPQDGRRPTKESLAPLELFAHQAAVAIENAKLIQQVKEYAQHLEEKVNERTTDLKRSEEKIKTIFTASPDAITATDLNCCIIECNDLTAKMHEYSSREELIGTNAMELVAKKDHPRAEDELKEMLEGGRAKTGEYTFVTKNGREFPAELSASVLKDASGHPIGFVAITKDITERKRMEQKLFRSERLAVIGQLAAMIGHDLRNPLTGITGAAYYLKTKMSSSMPEKGKEMLEIIEKDVAYSNKIISDLLDYSNEIKLELAEVTSSVLVKDSLSLVKIPNKVSVENSAMSQPLLNVDVVKLKRAFVNIIKNAVDAMPKGGTLKISNRLCNGSLEFIFADTGTGMSKETMRKIVQPLFTSKAKGMGFGLAISRRIVEAHGGKIIVESRVGVGSTFTIIIPIDRKEAGGETVWVNAPESLSLTTMKE